ncbi:hypothetical protein GXM_02852 [Nostoc sphaeroides CCNUC1]|uniref:Uncharacterized protein n=1 Tax=Nostoc sphaeroides CCNUC1 TaxID=2653204 RepID=A0A5P8VY80_9NOSO|nr:hypothetical protein GXM_02852 [Nostoc sphaeroides CCNUC1]
MLACHPYFEKIFIFFLPVIKHSGAKLSFFAISILMKTAQWQISTVNNCPWTHDPINK